MLNFFRSLFYSKDTKEVNEIFSSKANIFNCNSDVEYDGNLFFNGTVNGNLTCKFLKIGSNSLVAGNINLVAFGRNDVERSGVIFGLFNLILGVCELAVGMAIIIQSYNYFKENDFSDLENHED